MINPTMFAYFAGMAAMYFVQYLAFHRHVKLLSRVAEWVYVR
jgi:cytochrome c biogenesis protein CcdA